MIRSICSRENGLEVPTQKLQFPHEIAVNYFRDSLRFHSVTLVGRELGRRRCTKEKKKPLSILVPNLLEVEQDAGEQNPGHLFRWKLGIPWRKDSRLLRSITLRPKRELHFTQTSNRHLLFDSDVNYISTYYRFAVHIGVESEFFAT